MIRCLKTFSNYTRHEDESKKQSKTANSFLRTFYFGRKPSVATEAHSSCAKEWDAQAEKYEDMVRPRPRDYKSHSKRVKAKRTQALSASEKCASRMVEREAKKCPPSVYQVGETVPIRYPGTGSKLVKKRYVLEAQVLKRKLEKD